MAYRPIAIHAAIFADPLTPAEAETSLDGLVRLPRLGPRDPLAE